MGTQQPSELSIPLLPSASPCFSSEITVDFWKDTVTLTCPKEGAKFRRRNQEHPNPLTLTEESDLRSLESGEEFTCESSKIFLQAKVCEDCVELGLGLLAGIIVSDLLLTLGVLCLVYFCCKDRKNRFRGGDTQEKPSGPKADRPPPVPNPDYEPIRKGQREVYAGLGGRAF
ncbi:T-cell surface glycoprotein CD3 epsilon chain [Anolis sagrei]|uniref:T-cell surface glycoprotein CD3 epsilon chain n=1 Tax=Anolis sagrei TaxID=38937 RepID=UPI00352261C3